MTFSLEVVAALGMLAEPEARVLAPKVSTPPPPAAAAPGDRNIQKIDFGASAGLRSSGH